MSRNKSATIFWSLLDKHDNYKEILDDFKSSFEKESLPEDDLIAEELEKLLSILVANEFVYVEYI